MSDTLFIGANHIHLDEIGSTNSYAKELIASQNMPEGTLVTAGHQTAGRGQAGSRWQDEPSLNLAASYILYPGFLPVDKQFSLNMAISLAVRELCEELTGEEIRIKWPNDIYSADSKLAGILIENTIIGNMMGSSVIGIGLNVNQTNFDPALPNPCSIKTITGNDVTLEKVIKSLNGYIEKYYFQLRQSHFNFLDRAYTDNLYRYHRTGLFSRGGQTFRGEITGVSKEGKLLIHADGKELRFGMKEVEYL